MEDVCLAVETLKCEAKSARLKITVPDDASIEQCKSLTLEILLYPGHWIAKEEDNTYSIEDESGNKIRNVDVETVVDCNFKPDQTHMSLEYIRLEGMPSKIAISEILLSKPSTGETAKIIL